MKTVACVIARTNSKRLPEKVLQPVAGRCLIEHILDRLHMVRKLAKIYICTSTARDDLRLYKIAERNKVEFHAGSASSPIDRMLAVARLEDADCLVRITGDNVFTDPVFLHEMICRQEEDAVDYTRVMQVPLGLTPELISVGALKRCYTEIDPEKSEYLMLYLFQPERYRCRVILPEKKLVAPDLTLTVDTPEDLARTEFIFERISRPGLISYADVIHLSQATPIPQLKLMPSGGIKLPDGTAVSFHEFTRDMEQRTARSECVQLENGHYETVWRDLQS
jgi:spore coat polysaccharide biosynthesis protein SpsF